MAFEAVTFDGWDAGEFGELGSRQAGKKPGMFTAKNMMRYRNGLLGPRAGVRNLGLTGLPNGTIKALTAGTSGTVAVVGTGAYSFPRAGYGAAVTAWTGSVAGPFTKPCEVVGGFALGYLINPFQAVYRLNHVARTVTAVPAVPAGRCGTFYQDRLFVGGDPTHPARLLFSNPGQPGWETFAADAYLDLPLAVVITFITPFRSGLLVGGISNWFYYITGTVGFTSVVRALSVQGAPADTAKGLALGTDEVVYMAVDRPYEGSYNGALHTANRHLLWAGGNFRLDSNETPTYRAVKLIGPDEWLFLSGVTDSPLGIAANRALMHFEATHSYHTWEQNIGAWGMDLGGGLTLVARDGTGATPPTFYIFDPTVAKPGSVLDDNARPGDDSTTSLDAYVHLPQWFDPNGGEIQVRSVIVDFYKWNLGSPTNHFEVSARACNRYQQPDALPSTVIVFDEPTSATTIFGTDDRRTAFVGDQGSGGGFEVWIDHIRGVAIRSVTVEYERQPTRDL